MGWTISILPLHPGPRASSARQVKATLRSTLVMAWRRMLPERYWKTAVDWIDLPFDPLVTIEVEGERAEFRFYDSVEWPLPLARHWLEVAMFLYRTDFDDALAELDHGFDPFPESAFDSLRSSRFIEVEGAIGELNGDRVVWRVETPARRGVTPLETADPEVRAAVDQLRAHGVCGCPPCRGAFAHADKAPHISALPGFSLTKLDYFRGGIGRLAHSTGGWIVSKTYRRGSKDHVWLGQATSFGGVWSTRFQERGDGVAVIATGQTDSDVVVQLKVGSRAFAVMTSSDGGRMFSAPLRRDKAQDDFTSGVFWRGRDADELWTEGTRARLFRSTDRGRTFSLFASPETLDSKRIKRVQAPILFGDKLLAIVSTQSIERRLAESTDGGVHYRSLPVSGQHRKRDDLFVCGGAVVSFAWDYDTGRAFIACSRDEGATWSETELGIGMLQPARLGPAGAFAALSKSINRDVLHFFTSPDGERFEPCTIVDADRHTQLAYFADPTGQSVGYILLARWLYRIDRA